MTAHTQHNLHGAQTLNNTHFAIQRPNERKQRVKSSHHLSNRQSQGAGRRQLNVFAYGKGLQEYSRKGQVVRQSFNDKKKIKGATVRDKTPNIQSTSLSMRMPRNDGNQASMPGPGALNQNSNDMLQVIDPEADPGTLQHDKNVSKLPNLADGGLASVGSSERDNQFDSIDINLGAAGSAHRTSPPGNNF